jgi:hypothetical protein
MRWYLVALALFVSLLPRPARCEDVSLLHRDRVTFGLGAGYNWYTADPTPAMVREFTLGAHLGYPLTEHVGLALAGVWGTRNGALRVSPEARWRFTVAEAAMAFAVGYDFRSGKDDRLPEFKHEWAVGAYYARPVWRDVTVGAGVRTGLDSKLYDLSVGVRVPLVIGRDH